MRVFEARTADELFIKVAQALVERLDKGEFDYARGKQTVELEDTWLTLTNPEESIVWLPERAISLQYLKGEFEWYKSGSLNVEDIAKHSKFWRHIADPDGKVNSNYGYLTHRKFHGKSQFDWCVDRIKEDPCTRQALINFNLPEHKYERNRDFVCALQQIFRQKDGLLHQRVIFRSNDLIRGLTYDMPWFAYTWHKMAQATGYAPGVYHHFTPTMHVYTEHFDMLRKIAAATPVDTDANNQVFRDMLKS